MPQASLVHVQPFEVDERKMGRAGNRLLGEQQAVMRHLDFMRYCFHQTSDPAEKRCLDTLIEHMATDLVMLEQQVLAFARDVKAVKIMDGFNADPADLK